MIRARLILPLLWLCAMQAEAQDVAQTWNNASGLNGWDPRAYAPPSVLRTRIDLAAQTVAKAEASGDVELQITALLDLSRAQEEKGDLENAVQILSQNQAVVETTSKLFNGVQALVPIDKLDSVANLGVVGASGCNDRCAGRHSSQWRITSAAARLRS